MDRNTYRRGARQALVDYTTGWQEWLAAEVEEEEEEEEEVEPDEFEPTEFDKALAARIEAAEAVNAEAATTADRVLHGELVVHIPEDATSDPAAWTLFYADTDDLPSNTWRVTSRPDASPTVALCGRA